MQRPLRVVLILPLLYVVQTRMSHKQVEQHRRLKAKQHFDELRCLVPSGCDPKNDRNKVLQLAIEHLRNLKAGKPTSSASAVQDSEPDLMFSMDAEDGQHPKPESEADKRLSHNEVEQKRRQQARHHYDELRALLPNAGKYDKNTVLFHAIQSIRQLQGVSEQDLAKMVRELVSSQDNEQEPGQHEVVQHQAASNLALLANATATLSESPTDVVSFAATMALCQQDETHKNSRKRTSDMVGAASAQQPEVKQEAQEHVHGESTESESPELERKKARRLSGEVVVADVSAKSHGEGDSAQRHAESAFEAEMDSLDALSLLSHCAAQVQASQPPTPLMAPFSREGSWGEVSMMDALPPSSWTGKASLAAKAAAKIHCDSVAKT